MDARAPARRGSVAILALVVFPLPVVAKKATIRYLPVCAILILLLTSCGGGGSKQNPNGTPAGTYNLTVSATVGSNTQSTDLTLVVQ
jgi:hypothetical protein